MTEARACKAAEGELLLHKVARPGHHGCAPGPPSAAQSVPPVGQPARGAGTPRPRTPSRSPECRSDASFGMRPILLYDCCILGAMIQNVTDTGNVRSSFIVCVALAGFTMSASCTSSAAVPSPAPSPAPEGASASAATPTPDASREAELARLEELYWSRVEASRQSYHEADVAFMTGMIHHHAQAVVMSGHAPHNGADPSIQVLAARIINAQRDEIAFMRRWLIDRGQDAPDPLGAEANGEMGGDPAASVQVVAPSDARSGHQRHAQHGDHPPSGEHLMAGMLTHHQLAELANARGRDFDRLFLTYMIMHHEGAVTMVRGLMATDGAAQATEVFKLASDIQVDQRSEITRMRLMLEDLSGEGNPAPSPA